MVFCHQLLHDLLHKLETYMNLQKQIVHLMHFIYTMPLVVHSLCSSVCSFLECMHATMHLSCGVNTSAAEALD